MSFKGSPSLENQGPSRRRRASNQLEHPAAASERRKGEPPRSAQASTALESPSTNRIVGAPRVMRRVRRGLGRGHSDSARAHVAARLEPRALTLVLSQRDGSLELGSRLGISPELFREVGARTGHQATAIPTPSSANEARPPIWRRRRRPRSRLFARDFVGRSVRGAWRLSS